MRGDEEDPLKRELDGFDAKPLKQFLRWASLYRSAIIIVVIAGMLRVIFALAQPLIMRKIIDEVLLNASLRSHEKIVFSIGWGSLVVILIFLVAVFSLLRHIEREKLIAKFSSMVRLKVFVSMLNLPLGVLRRLKAGGAADRLINDSQNVTGLLRNIIFIPCIEWGRILVTVILIFWVNWKLTLVTLLLVPPALIFSSYAIRKLKPLSRELFQRRSNLFAAVSELFRGMQIVSLYNRESREKWHLAQATHKIARLQIKEANIRFKLQQGWSLLQSLAIVSIVCIGSIFTIIGYASIGDILALSLYSGYLMQPVQSLVSARSDAQSGLEATRRLCEVLHVSKLSRVSNEGIPFPLSLDKLEFHSVDFEYNPENIVLSNVSCSVGRGETIALVGRSGAGKTTFIDVLLRFYNPTKGKITLNGRNYLDYRLNDFRKSVAMVEQEVTLFDGSIAENIAYAKPKATEVEIRNAALFAEADGFIRSFPEEYETIVGENGLNLSGGQRQRLSIARAFLADPKLLILDEATSNLDYETERCIQRSMEKLLKDRTTIIIAHRLSTIQKADKIILLEKGKIIEMGSHQELIKKEGSYYSMVKSQSEAFEYSYALSV